MAFERLTDVRNEPNEVELTTIGRISGRESSEPVWFVRRDENLYLLPVCGTDSQWYKNLLKTPTVRVAAGDTVYSGQAVPVTDPPEVNQVVERFRNKYGARQVDSYFSRHDVAVEVRPA